ncbi:MAG TPA: DUF4232 domain-containing protein [Streptosporangiaceae bacterium]|nr:DUF4232 domain-containing protein [Streptosporangiaceae bacterium]
MKPFVVAVLAAAGLTTCACGTSGGTAQPTNTVTVTAPASTAATSPATSGGGSTQPVSATSTSSGGGTAAAGCLTRYLNGSAGLSQGAAGSTYIAIVFKNLNNVPCTLYGFPGIAQANGTPVTDVGQPSTEDHSTARELVTLQPGGYANATLRIVQGLNYPTSVCKPVTAQWLAVIPPNQYVPLYVHYSSTACKGMTVHLLTVTAVRPGNGG